MRIDSELIVLKEIPRAIAVSPSGDRVYLANPGVEGSLRSLRRPRGTVTVVDPYARSEVAHILVGRSPFSIAVDPDGERIYVANLRSNDVSIVDVRAAAETSRVKVGKQPRALACSEGRLYVANAHAGTMSVVDTDTQRVLDTVRTGRQPTSVVVSPSGDRVYVGTNDATVSVIDTRTLGTVATIEVGHHPVGIALNSSGMRLYVANRISQSITVIDTAGLKAIRTIQLSTLSRRQGVGFFAMALGEPVMSQPMAVGVSGDGTRLLVAFWEAGTLAVLDARSGSRVSETQLDDGKYSIGPIEIAADWPNRRLYVSCADHALVTVRDEP
ncbi:YncE family protein [Streptomyces sp. NPDC050263]|uniref:YncE family protein n=1 Tax=Streptomyces sp. NPDC050263 TaxID=3155037 RepID=UPI003430355F